VLGVIDTYGIELIHPIREGRSPQQIGRKGVSNHRWRLLLDSRVVDLSMAYNPTFVILSSPEALIFQCS
jgi:hypothetical protein